jgi:hypothetical protein
MSLPTIDIKGRWIKTAYLDDGYFIDVAEPGVHIDRARERHADLFTFWPRLGVPWSPSVDYSVVIKEQLAVMPVTTYDHWFTKQVHKNARNLVRKCEKSGVEIRSAQFDDAYIAGIVKLFNEAPMRQGMKFWHYGKGLEQIRREFSRFLHRETLYGAYLGDELVGILWLSHTEHHTAIGQILASLHHRDKSIPNALVAHAVKVTAERGHASLIYAIWPRTGLADFKHQNGFRPVDVMRYVVPLTIKGRIAIALGLHEPSWNWPWMPSWLFTKLRAWRSAYHTWQTRTAS